MRLRSLPSLVALGALVVLAVMAGPAAAQEAEGDVFVAQAILAYEEKRYEEALAILRQALELAPKHVDALYYTGLVLVALDRLDEAAAALEQARTQAPKDEAVLFQLGAVYFGAEKYDRARPLLEQVFDVHPRLEGLGYYVGFMRYRQGDYQGALRAFRAGTSQDPRVQQLAGLYSGLALRALGLPERAAAEIEQAQRLLPASPLTGPAERLREAAVAAREKERRFGVELRLGGFYDDNVPVNPEASADPRVQDLRQRKHESFGELASLRLDYSFLRVGSFDATATYSLFTTFNNELPDFNIVDHLGGLRGTYRDTVGGLPYWFSLQYTYDYLTLGGDKFVQRHTITPYAVLLEGSRNLTAFQLGYQVKDFAESADTPLDDRRDGTNWLAGLSHTFRFEQDKHFLRFGYQFDFDDTKGRNLSYLGHRILAGAQYTFPWAGVRVNYDFDVHLREYRHRHTLLPDDAPNTRERSDRESTHVVALTVPLPWNFSLVTQYQFSDSRSNLDVFTFKRNVFFLFLIWAY